MPAIKTLNDERQFPYWRRNIKVIPLSNLLASLGFGLSWPFLPLMVRGLGVESNLETWIGNMALVFYIVSFVMNPIWGGIADHYGRKIMVLRATLGMGACMVLAAFAPTPLWFAFLLCCVGVFNGSTAAGMALIVANTPPARMGRALSLAQTGTLVGQTMGPAVGAMLATVIERQHWLFWISGAMMLLAGALVAAFVHEVKQLAPGPLAAAVDRSAARAAEECRGWAALSPRLPFRGAVERQRHHHEPLRSATAVGAGCGRGH